MVIAYGICFNWHHAYIKNPLRSKMLKSGIILYDYILYIWTFEHVSTPLYANMYAYSFSISLWNKNT